METNIIYNEDCIQGMEEKIPDNSIDLIVIDPPYNIGKAEWDKIDNYIEWMGKVFLECQRTLKDNGSFYFWHNDFEVMADLQHWIKRNTMFKFKQFINWNKIEENFYNYGFVQQRLSVNKMRNYYSGFTEYCLFYTFQDETGLQEIYSDKELFKPTKQYLINEKKKSGLTNKDFNIMFSEYYNKDGCKDRSVIEHYWQNSQWTFPTKEIYENILQRTGYFQKPYYKLRKEYENLRLEYEELRLEYEDLRYTFNVQKVKEDLRANSNDWHYPPAEKQGHITPKPVEMIENIIKHSSNENDIVLDCFMGSGTTAVACNNLNRRYIGFEKEEKYIDVINNRLNDQRLQLFA